IAELKARATALRDEHKYAEAVEVLEQVCRLDPEDPWEAEQHRLLSRFVELLNDRDAVTGAVLQEEKQMVGVLESSIPWYSLIRYPRDWDEIELQRRSTTSPAPADSEVQRVLRIVLPRLNFSGIALGDVIQFLRDVGNVSIHVKWDELGSAGINPNSPVNVSLTACAFEKALREVLSSVRAGKPLGYVANEGVIVVSTVEDLGTPTATRVYDIRDLLAVTPQFRGPRIDLSSGGNNNSGNGLFGRDKDDVNEARRGEIDGTLDLIRSAVAPQSWSANTPGAPGKARVVNGQLIVEQTADNLRTLEELLAQLREARGSQLQLDSSQIAGQKVRGLLAEDSDGDAARTYGAAANEWERFVRSNYPWSGLPGPATTATTQPTTQPAAPSRRQLAETLARNRGQKIVVNSTNVNVDTATANALGIDFKAGNNGTAYTIIDEARFRALRDLERRRRTAEAVPANPRFQETIVGTDALLANGMIANNPYAAERYNEFDINDNSIILPHDQYILISNGGFLTAMRAGAMQNWREQPEDVRFAEVPADFDVPAVGREARFERKLLQPTDPLFIKAEYAWKGGER
ncbi:MAG TPA: hypothetical protein VM389_01135, partial [Phycisphaerae bacterium]|nr:hypothetical protein [Phycisphaerae bacterium]